MKTSATLSHLLPMLHCSMLGASANAGVTFYTNEATFDASTSTTLSDFEGLIADNDRDNGPTQVIDSVTYTGNAVLTGPNSGTVGSPFNSAFIHANLNNVLTIDLTTAGSGYTSLGADFGDLNGTNKSATISLIGNGGSVLDTQSVIVGGVSVGSSPKFFGWTTDGGDVIEGLTFSLDEDLWEAVDDVRFGNVIPEPASLALLGVGGLAMLLCCRRA